MRDLRRLPLLALFLALGVAFGVPSALGQSIWEQQQSLDQKISGLQSEISRAKHKEGVLTTEISSASSQISALQGDISVLTAKVAALESDLAAHRARLERLKERYEQQTERYNLLRRDHRIALGRLEARLVQLYETADTSELDVILQSNSLSDLIEQIDYFHTIGDADKQLADHLQVLSNQMRVARMITAATKSDVADATAVLARETERQRAARDALVVRQNALAAARSNQRSLLASVRTAREKDEENLAAMQAASAAIAAKIRAHQSASGSSGNGTSSSGLIWPVNGPITSGFGWRWGRMHEGIDIGVPCGTPIHAAASGTVIYSGWMDGYGNFVVIDHGNGLATAYGHQSAIYVSGGSVSQGQSIGAVGSTGNSTGCHLHFEVRVNGNPVDPLGYL
ncbi:MAG TPA: peptidoglycan DD-metalloendopeptidase family protein [Gaiellaceae bacterium]|nr:peptidoglycan DD-metalloendopeptidase family protein [Gaiellaceae bacterium]